MKFNKSHFEIHSRFRNGIFMLSILIVLYVIGYYFVKSNTSKEIVNNKPVKIDTTQSIETSKEKSKQSFNPNFISDYKGYALGLTVQEIDLLLAFRKKGKWIRSAEEFQQVTKVSDSVLERIAPFFKFPVFDASFKKKVINLLPYDQKKNLNAVTSITIQKEGQVPDFIAKRIVAYRTKIGGFISDKQLNDVKMYDHQRKRLLSLFTVKVKPNVNKININSATVKELIEVPYIDFQMALDIKDFIKLKKRIERFDQLVEICNIPLEKVDKIKLYLTLD